MRIVAGRHRGRRLAAPEGRATRPTADRTREAVFNVLGHGLGLDLDGLSVIDLFAGSGALGLEALSRGARRAVFVDRDRASLRAVRRNAATLGEVANVLALGIDASRLPPPPRAAGAPFGLAFLDPPYGAGLAGPALTGLARRGWLAAGAALVVEIGRDDAFGPPAGFALRDDRGYGAARVLFLGWGGADR